ncbi:DNA polymerase III subunit alpha [Chryseobacterium rhizoplanae]|uniref:DNA polymerase III subunit alpha n=1 Tax=Chryseobacterium rhizoplanae TaxID=1609531 RepID=UPI001CE3B5C5|nr:DNA polymerase III subunit alpha [Chryseobacterium rhizoplanae]UCA58498.1 DNA polymerase III subunit alpha [Chryseobacterium rhizoplanae]
MYLNCHSYHSLRYGTISVKELVQECVELNIQVAALTDINTMTGIYDFHRLCGKHGIKPVVGMEIRNDNNLYYICLAKSKHGLGEINRLLTGYNCEGKELPKYHPSFSDVFTIYPLSDFPIKLKSNEYIGVRPEELNLLINPKLKRYLSKMVILQPVTYRTKKEYNLHRILRAIDRNTLVTKLEENDYCKENEKLISASGLISAYRQYPQIIRNTTWMLEQCHFEFDYTQPKNKRHFTGSKESDFQLLKDLAYKGLKERYPHDDETARARVEKELTVIDLLNFSAYFLITWDIIQYSNTMGFMHVGRGSGANSIIAYCLGITDICPLELDLYFERFLNLNRKTPPDFDIDWSWQERDMILQYIFDKYGKDHVAFCGTNVEFKYKSIFREVGKAFGLPKEELDALATQPVEQHDVNSVSRLVHKYGKLLEKFPNQRSMHACGILISEEPITNFTALELPPKGFPIVQFDMHIAEEIGFEKFDILSQRGLGTINDAVKLIEEKRGITVDIRNTKISKDESKCNEFLSQGRTIGCFYIESPAMRGLLRRLKCDNYKTLVAASSIIRPGVAQSGMMKEYIFRHNNPDKFEYFHEVFKKELGETYGIMVYQEDVIKIALHFGGLSAPDGDILRRAMSGKGRSLTALQKVKNHFFESCEKLGHPEQLSKEVYRQIESFAGYSFCKAHSASYAVESYQSLYLKVYYPIEFMVAAINNGGGFYRTEVYIHETRMSGGNILNPCVNKSELRTTLYGKDVYLGFMHIEKLESKIAALIPEERKKNGEYLSLENFVKRIPIGIETLQTLIFIGAFRFTGKQKHELLIEARFLLAGNKPKVQLTLLEEPQKKYTLPEVNRHPMEDAFDEIEILGFPVSVSPFDLLQTKYRGSVMARDLTKYHKKQVKMLAYLIARKHVPTKRGAMYFGTWIDAEGEYFDTAHFSDCLAQYPFQGGGCYLLLGTVEVDFHFPAITIQMMAKMPFIPDPRYSLDKEKAYEAYNNIREDISMTWRKPYPQQHEIGLPRMKMNSNGK